MRLPEEPDLPPQINIVPMIDVIFAVLTFFIMSSLFLTRLEGLPVNLPQANTAERQTRQTEITVTLNPQGQIALNQESVTLDDLARRVQQLQGNRPEALVIINADTATSHGRVVAVMDRLRVLPGVRLAIAAERPQ